MDESSDGCGPHEPDGVSGRSLQWWGMSDDIDFSEIYIAALTRMNLLDRPMKRGRFNGSSNAGKCP
jgi:hypothetical protein